LSDSSELIVDRTVANADPTVISTQIRNGDATQMCADSRAHQKLGGTSIGQDDFFTFIQDCINGVFVFLLDFTVGKSSNEDGLTVPDNLHNFTGRKFRDVHLHVSIFIVSLPTVESSDNSDSVASSEGEETSIVDGGENV
jgi:hypothetical protein